MPLHIGVENGQIVAKCFTDEPTMAEAIIAKSHPEARVFVELSVERTSEIHQFTYNLETDLGNAEIEVLYVYELDRRTLENRNAVRLIDVRLGTASIGHQLNDEWRDRLVEEAKRHHESSFED